MKFSRRRKRSSQPVEALESRLLLSASSTQTRATDVPQPAIVNGTQTNGYKGVGIVNDFCSGTLITPIHVLTAAHCTVDLDDDEGYFKVGRKRYNTQRITEHFNYDDDAFYMGFDLSIMELTKPVKNVKPYEIHTGAPQVGQNVTLVGFGIAGNTQQGQTDDYGTKRKATTRIDDVFPLHIQWTIDSHDDGSIYRGDSGGPALLKVDGELKIVGVTSGFIGDPYTIGSKAFDNRVDVFSDWIAANTAVPTNVRATFANGNVTLKGDAGDNSVIITQGAVVGVDGTLINGRSFVQIPNGGITGNLTMQFTKGDNKVSMDQPVAANLTYKGGNGRDGVRLLGDVGGNLNIKTGGGLDAVALEQFTVNGNLTISTGGGRDKIDIYGVDVLDSTNIATGNGNDEMLIGSTTFESIALKFGGGNDFLAIDSTEVDGAMNANLGGGNDDLYVQSLAIAGTSTTVLNGGGGLDTFQGNNITYVTPPNISSMERSSIPNVFTRISELIDCIDELTL